MSKDTFHLPLESYHFSIDDVLNSLIEVSDKNIPLFDHPFFSFIKELHEQFAANIDLYLFYQEEINGKLRSLQDVSNSIKQTFQANPWITFGPHAYDYATAPYTKTPSETIAAFDKIYTEIKRFAGEENFSHFARLHYFSELYELKEYFKNKGVEALFSTDKEVVSHRMPENIKNDLRSKGIANYEGMNFIRSHFRVENFITMCPSGKQKKTYLKTLLEKYGFIIFFTHECDVSNPEVIRGTIKILKTCKDFGLISI